MTKIKQTIAQLLPKLESGGVERGTIDIANAIAKNGYRSIVISNGGRLVKNLHQDVLHLTLEVDSKNPFVIYRNIRKLEILIKRYNINILHVRSRAPAFSAYFACKRSNSMLFSTFHGTYSTSLFCLSFLKRKYNAIMLKSQKIIAVSHFIKNHIEEEYQYKKDNIKVIHRGVDTSDFSCSNINDKQLEEFLQKNKIDRSKFIITLPGRITHWKGQDILIDAIKNIEDDILCLIIGSKKDDEKYYKQVNQKILDNKLSKKIKLIDNIENIKLVYFISNVLVSSSRRPEAFGRIAIEAGSMKRIVVASDIGGSLETVIDKKTGFLFKSSDSNDLSSVIKNVMKLTKEDRNRIQDNAYFYVKENFSNNKMIKETMNLYQIPYKNKQV